MGTVKLPITTEGGGKVTVLVTGVLDFKGNPGQVTIIKKG